MKTKSAILFGIAVGCVPLFNCEAGSVAHTTGEVRTIVLPGGAEMEMIWCGPGSFEMGSPSDEKGRFDDEPRHKVELTQGFWLGKYEVTQRQWTSVMHINPSRFKRPDNPVDSVSWHDCEMFVRRVNAALGGLVRFPAEAEWEYACRAGGVEPVSGTGELSDMAWYDKNSDGQTHPVGTRKPNAWGFHDMAGNVAEWCSDRHADYYIVHPKELTDPKGGDSSVNYRTVRGGCFYSYWTSVASRSVKRDMLPPNWPKAYVGFRMAMDE